MLKLVVFEISSPYGYSKVRNTSLRFLWPRTGLHTVVRVGRFIQDRVEISVLCREREMLFNLRDIRQPEIAESSSL